MLVALAVALGALGGSRASAQTPDHLAEQVRQAERAFAATMAARDFAAFAAHVSEEAVFFGARGAQRGRAAVLAAWRAYFEGSAAPFSWEPDSVVVLDSGTLAWSSGPVRDASGRRIGTFNSVWRLEADGRWRVIFDRGCPSR
jgi:ketosteroid isomerase-like protein